MSEARIARMALEVGLHNETSASLVTSPESNQLAAEEEDKPMGSVDLWGLDDFAAERTESVIVQKDVGRFLGQIERMQEAVVSWGRWLRSEPRYAFSDHGWLQKWQQLGLAGTNIDMGRMSTYATASLITSLESGQFDEAVATMLDHDNSIADLVSRYVQSLTGYRPIPKRAATGTEQIVQYDGISPDGRSLYETLHEAYREAKELPLTTKTIEGPHHSRFTAVHKQIASYFPGLEGGLQPNDLSSRDYMDEDELRALDIRMRQAGLTGHYEYWQGRRPYELEAIADELWETYRQQTVAPGLFDAPPFMVQKDRECTAATFRMVFAGITGAHLDVDASPEFAWRMGALSTNLVKLFDTQWFATEYGKQVKTIHFSGMDYATLSRIAEKIKQRDPEYKVFVVTSLGSEAYMKVPVILHSSILLSVDDTYVTFHDPARQNGGFRQQTRRTFNRRWARAMNSGYVVVSR